MPNKIIAYGLFASIGLALLTGFFESSMSEFNVEALITLAGLGMIVSGIWAGVRLLKDSE